MERLARIARDAETPPPNSKLVEELPRLMAGLRQGNNEAARELVTVFYRELHKLAASKMRGESPGHTWQPTALVNELYLELAKIRALEQRAEYRRDDREAFFALAAHIMRRLLITHARPSRKRFEESGLEGIDVSSDGSAQLAEVDAILAKLGQIDPRLRSVVELRVFEGMTGEEIAEHLGCAPRTVARHWDFARRWLQTVLDAPS
jgi:RNA polymerase sigma factor (TIGR02999 family)